jgi:hypothetical protein
LSGDPSRIRTCNPRSRNPLLYPVELWDPSGHHITANMKNPLPRQADRADSLLPVVLEAMGASLGPEGTSFRLLF